jgi:hypothetical protein
MKPIELVERAIRNSSKSRDSVLDLFGGPGITMIAAERAGRRARLVELDPKYVDVIMQRWQTLSGGSASHASTGQPFGTHVTEKAVIRQLRACQARSSLCATLRLGLAPLP